MARFLLVSLGFMVIASIGLGTIFYYMVAWGFFGPVPDTKEILNHENSTASEIYSSVKKLSGMIKNLPGVKSITVDKYNKKKITLRGNKIIF